MFDDRIGREDDSCDRGKQNDASSLKTSRRRCRALAVQDQNIPILGGEIFSRYPLHILGGDCGKLLRLRVNSLPAAVRIVTAATAA